MIFLVFIYWFVLGHVAGRRQTDGGPQMGPQAIGYVPLKHFPILIEKKNRNRLHLAHKINDVQYALSISNLRLGTR